MESHWVGTSPRRACVNWSTFQDTLGHGDRRTSGGQDGTRRRVSCRPAVVAFCLPQAPVHYRRRPPIGTKAGKPRWACGCMLRRHPCTIQRSPRRRAGNAQRAQLKRSSRGGWFTVLCTSRSGLLLSDRVLADDEQVAHLRRIKCIGRRGALRGQRLGDWSYRRWRYWKGARTRVSAWDCDRAWDREHPGAPVLATVTVTVDGHASRQHGQGFAFLEI